MDVKHDGSGVGVPAAVTAVPLLVAFPGIAVADPCVGGVPLRTVCEDLWLDYAHSMVTDWIYEYCSTSHVLGTRMGTRNHLWWARAE
jgi:hypothetical protein